MGTMIQSLGLDEEGYRGARFDAWNREVRGNNDLLILTQPDAVRDIHLAYFRAGADIVSTNTFSSTRIAQSDYGMSGIAHELNVEGARLARAAADLAQSEDGRPRFVAGALGPTNRTASISPDVSNPGFRAVTFDELRAAYAEQVKGLIEGGADLLLIETIFDTLNAKAAIAAIADVAEAGGARLPVMISGTITDRSGRLLSGQTPAAFWNSVRHAAPFSVGLNCALGAKEMRAHIAEIARIADTLICAYPNAGLPNEFGRYDESPEYMAGLLAEFADAGLVNVVGGCCGTTPEHIHAIARAVEGKPPRQVPEVPRLLRLSGLEAFALTPEIPFVNVGERTNVTGSAKFRKLITAGDYPAALAIARDQVENGAQIIDVNMDEGLLDSEQAMVTFLNLIAAEPDIARVPVMVDSSKFSVIEAGLKCLQGKAVVNSISMKEGEAAFIEHARTVRRYGAAVVVMAFDEQGQADTVERKTAICARAYDILVNQVGFPPEDIIFDPNIFAVATGMEEHNGYGVAFIEAARAIRRDLPGVHISGGVSNLSFSFRGNERRARGHALGVPLSRHQGRHGYGHRQCRADRGLRRPRSGIARGLRGRGARPPAGRRRAPARDRAEIPRARQGEEGGRHRLARAAGEGAALARAGARHHRFHRDRHRGGAACGRAAAARDRRAADGRHERGRRPVRLRPHVPAAGGQIRARDEAGGRLSDALHGAGEEGQGHREEEFQRQDRDGHRQGRRARHRQEHRRRRAPVQQLRGGRSRRDGAGGEDPGDGASRRRPTSSGSPA